MTQFIYVPAHPEGSSREVYEIKRPDEKTFMLYMIDRKAQSHTLWWNGHICLVKLLDWDERFVHLTRPDSEKKTHQHGQQCVADLELIMRSGKESYHLEFDNEEHRIVKGLARGQLQRAEINHVPFDLCALNGADDASSSISVGMHGYRPFPLDIFDMYNTTTLADFKPIRPQSRVILGDIHSLAHIR